MKNIKTLNMVIVVLVILLAFVSKIVPDYKDIKLLMIPVFLGYIYMTRITYWWNILYEILIVISLVVLIIGDDIFGEKVVLANGAVLRYPVTWTLWLPLVLIAFYPILSWIMKKKGYIILKSDLEEEEYEK